MFVLTSHSKVGSIVTIPLIGAAGFATVPMLQKLVMDRAAGAPTLASSANIAAFNLGNALAARVGGLVISAGLGYSAPSAAGALAVAVLSGRLERRTERRTGHRAGVAGREPVAVG